MKRTLSVILAVVLCLGMTSAALAEAAEINFPNMWVGVNGSTDWFNELKGEFDKQYEGKYKLVVEEIPGDQAYVDKIKVLYSSDSLPSAFNCGGYNLIDLMRDKLLDLTPYLDADPEWKAGISEVGLNVNSRDGRLYGIPQAKQVIGYFYNKALFEKAGIAGPAATWEEFFAQCEQLKAAGITPVSMDTADSGWVTSLMLGAMIGASDAGEAFMNTLQPLDYNTPEFIEAAGNIQRLFMNYTTSDAVGGKYEHAAANFYAGKTAMIANGPWMISSFYDASMAPEGFADQVGVAAYPGNVMYNSGKIGFNVGAKSPEEIEAALAFVKFFTSPHAQQRALEMTGEIPDNPTVTSDEVYPLVNETIRLGANAGRSINDFQSLWFANVVDEVSVQYPLLAQNAITPEAFAQALTAAAQKNVD